MAKVLTIEDDVLNRKALKFTLEKAGHWVAEASDGEEGLTLAQKNPPDLILLDILMPKMDGWEVCRTLKKYPQTSRIPIVMLTTCNKKPDTHRGFRLGVDEYLTKPWTPALAMETVARLLYSRSDEYPEESREEQGDSKGGILAQIVKDAVKSLR